VIEMKKCTIAISEKTRATLNKLSELSGLDVKYFVDEWAGQLQKILDKRGAMQRISLMSIRSKKFDNVITLVEPLVLLSGKFPDSVSDEEAEKQLKGES